MTMKHLMIVLVMVLCVFFVVLRYYGMLMWVPQDDAEVRPFMMEALRTLSMPED